MKEHFIKYKKIYIPIIFTSILIGLGILIILGLINGRIASFVDNFSKSIAPITIGFIIAYLINPIVMFLEKRVLKWIPNFNVKRFISILIAMLFMFIVITIILLILIPSLINTLKSFWNTYVVNYENSIRNLVKTLNATMDRVKLFSSMDRLEPESSIAWVQTKFPWIVDIATGDIEGLLPNVTNSVTHNISVILDYLLSFGTSVFNFIKNFIFGIFIAFYMLMSKEKCKAYIKRLLNSLLSPQKVKSVLHFGNLVHESFGGFIEGQLLDAVAVGIISYIIFLIFGIPIPYLLATIIGLTNIIPILGPFLGGIPATFLVLLTAPEKTILMVLLIILIQQIDGNLLCPHIIGDKIQISSLATIIVIITMGGLFGIFGMLIGVPVFAVVIHMVNERTVNRLQQKNLPTSLQDYYNEESITTQTDKSANKNKGKFKLIKPFNKNKNNKKEK